MILASLVTVGFAAFGQIPDWAAKAQQAKQAMASQRFAEAVSLYKELAAAFPDSAGLALNVGLALYSSGDCRSAVRQLQSVVKTDATLEAAWFLLGVCQQRLNRPAQAIEPLKRALELQSNNHTARVELADALFQTGRFSEAVSHFRFLVDVDRNNPKAWLGLGLSYASLANEAVERVQKLFPDSAHLYMLLGRSLADQKQYRSAFHYYRQALAQDPSLTDAHREIASIYRLSGHPDWAVIEEEKARQSTQAACSQINYACLFAEKRYEELLERAKESKETESFYWQARTWNELAMSANSKLADLPPSAELHQLMAVLYDMRGLYLHAAEQWRTALSFQPKNLTFRKRLAQSLWSAGDWKPAFEAAQALLEAGSDSSDVRFLIGDSLVKMQMPEQAVPHLTSAVSLDPAHRRAHSSLATAYVRLGRHGDATRHLEAALPLDEDGTLRYQLAQAYRSAGLIDRAAKVLAEYREIRKRAHEKDLAGKAEREITPP